MPEIIEKRYQEVKKNAFIHFSENKKVLSPIFWEVKVTEQAFNHIENKNKKHKRSKQEAFIRYLCFMNFDYIIKNSYLYQDFNEEYNQVIIKKKKWKVIENRLVKFYWLISIVNNDKQRVKIVLKKVDGFQKYEYVSVIPVWKVTDNWPQLYLDSESDL